MQKQQIACDENYRDPTNLQSKIQKHAAFESELAANRGRVNNVTTEGESLIAAGHFAGMEIQARLDELEAEWRQLQEASALKRERLNDAYQVKKFYSYFIMAVIMSISDTICIIHFCVQLCRKKIDACLLKQDENKIKLSKNLILLIPEESFESSTVFTGKQLTQSFRQSLKPGKSGNTW